MPFDNPRTFTLDLAGLAAWLETQDPETRYDFLSTQDCLLCRFGRALGFRVEGAGRSYFRAGVEPDQFHQVVPPDSEVADAYPWTYGAALERARALL